MEIKIKRQKRYRRHKRVRAKISGTSKIPRLCVFRSNRHIYAQLIDDKKGRTLVAANDLELKKTKTPAKGPKPKKGLTRKVALAFEVGKLIAQKALKKKIQRVIFDRGGYKYHGRVKAVANGAREGGLKF
jgi:large subunit ribosomal protein L18